MVDDNIGVRPSTTTGSESVATDKIDNVHYPIYKTAFGPNGEVVLVDTDNPLPIQALGLEGRSRDLLEVNEEILKQLKIMNSHFSEWDGDEHGGS